MKEYNKILDFWFSKGFDQLDNETWFKKDENFDLEIKDKFLSFLEQGRQGLLEDWKITPAGSLAYIILFDQFSRNIYRDTPKSFAQDEKAFEAVKEGIKGKQDISLTLPQRFFFYLPYMHSEILSDQEMALELFRSLFMEAPEGLKEGFKSIYEFALAHHKIIEEFGRFPHRNEILGRKSTDVELSFLKKPGSKF